MKKDLLKTSLLMSAIVLVTVGAALLLNLLTGPKIAADKAYRDELAAQQAAGVLLEVFPGATGFEDITTTLTIDPASGVSAVHKETSGKGYVFVASKTNSPMKGLVDVPVAVDGLHVLPIMSLVMATAFSISSIYPACISPVPTTDIASAILPPPTAAMASPTSLVHSGILDLS